MNRKTEHIGISRALLLLAVLLIGIYNVSGQVFKLHGNIRVENGNLDDVTVILEKNGKKAGTTKPNAIGHYVFELDLQAEYKLTFEKPGYVSKSMIVDTKVPTDKSENDINKIKWETKVRLFKQYEGMNFMIYAQPVQRIAWNKKQDKFDYDTDYTAMFLSQIQKIEEQVNQKIEEEAKQIEAAQQAEQAAIKKAEEDAKREEEAAKKAAAEEQARQLAEKRALDKAEAEAKKAALAEEKKKQAELEAQQRAEEKERLAKLAEERKIAAEKAAQEKAEADAKARAEAEAKRKEDERLRQLAADEKRKQLAEEEAARKALQEQRLQEAALAAKSREEAEKAEKVLEEQRRAEKENEAKLLAEQRRQEKERLEKEREQARLASQQVALEEAKRRAAAEQAAREEEQKQKMLARYESELARTYPAGKKIEIIEDPNKKTTRVIISTGKDAQLYRKVEHDWGGIFFFKGVHSISPTYYFLETGEL